MLIPFYGRMKLSTFIYISQRHFSLLVNRYSLLECKNVNQQQQSCYSAKLGKETQFRVLELIKKRRPKTPPKNFNEKFFKPAREKAQSVTQDWGSLWPGIRSFHPATVPLPIRMGIPHSTNPPPDKWGNAELMKIPNFLHLTPPVIKNQCEALKRFCTQWPKELETEEAQNYHYPVVVTRSSYLHSSPSIRDPKARVVSLQVNIDNLALDAHAEDKLLRLVGDRFDPKTRVLTLVADRCPLSSQNLDYCFYLLTVIYNESLKTEPWEHEKETQDYESYSYSIGKTQSTLEHLEEKTGAPLPEHDKETYIKTVARLHNEGEDDQVLEQLRKSSLSLLKLA